jgi:hypothetical protein
LTKTRADASGLYARQSFCAKRELTFVDLGSPLLTMSGASIVRKLHEKTPHQDTSLQWSPCGFLADGARIAMARISFCDCLCWQGSRSASKILLRETALMTTCKQQRRNIGPNSSADFVQFTLTEQVLFSQLAPLLEDVPSSPECLVEA